MTTPFAPGETVRFLPRSRDLEPMDAVIVSAPIGLREVPAMGRFYFIIAPAYRGFVSEDRLARVTRPRPRLTDFARRSEFETEP